MKKIILLPAILLLVLTISYAQPGKIDSLFGNKGIVTTDIGKPLTHNGFARQVLLNSDGSMYVIIETNKKTIIAKNMQMVHLI